MENLSVEKRVTKALLTVLREQPFYGAILLSLEIYPDTTCDTAWTDGRYIGYNPAFFEDKPDKFIQEVLEHEVLHVTLGHIEREGARNHFLWNVATDKVIDIIQETNCEEVPSAERLYDELIQAAEDKTKDQDENGLSGTKQSGDGQSKYGPHEVRNTGNHFTEEERKKLVGKAVATAMRIRSDGFGTLPHAVQIEIEELTSPPKVKWQEIVTKRYDTCGIVSSFNRPSKRSPEGLYLPGHKKEGEAVNVIVALDVSGSMDDRTLATFMNELKYFNQLYEVSGWVVQFDTELEHVIKIDDTSNISYNIRYGCGGTSFVPIFTFADKVRAEEFVDPQIIVFTDMDGQFPDANEYRHRSTIWISTSRRKEAPFGVVVRY